MTLLKFFLEFGKNGLGALWIPYIGLSIWFLYQTYVAYNSGGTQQVPGGRIDDNEKTSLLKIGAFKFFLAITVAAVIIHFMIENSYK